MPRNIENGVIVLTANDGMILTDNFSYGSVVRLGKEANESMWYEITEEEANKRKNGEEATEEDYQSALREMGVRL